MIFNRGMCDCNKPATAMPILCQPISAGAIPTSLSDKPVASGGMMAVNKYNLRAKYIATGKISAQAMPSISPTRLYSSKVADGEVSTTTPSSPVDSARIRNSPSGDSPIDKTLTDIDSKVVDNIRIGEEGTSKAEVVGVDDSGDLKSKLKIMWKTYGTVAIGTYLSIYVMTLSAVFTCIDLDIFHAASVGLDPVKAIKKVCDIFESITGSGALSGYIKTHPRVGSFAIAWVLTKFTEPVRLGVTVVTVPAIARFFGKVPKKI